MARDTTDFVTTSIVLRPGAGQRSTSTDWYRCHQEIIGAVTLDRLTIQTTSVEAFREVAELCTEVADRMQQMYAEVAASRPDGEEGAPEGGRP